MTDSVKAHAAQLAIGRLFRLASRPERAGDVQAYEQCRSLILNLLGDGSVPMREHGYAPLPGWNFGSGSSGCIE